MAATVKLPISIENFEDIRTKGFYYVDKTGLIREILDNWSTVNLFTRPRRFGKSLNMSMLEYYGCDDKYELTMVRGRSAGYGWGENHLIKRGLLK